MKNTINAPAMVTFKTKLFEMTDRVEDTVMMANSAASLGRLNDADTLTAIAIKEIERLVNILLDVLPFLVEDNRDYALNRSERLVRQRDELQQQRNDIVLARRLHLAVQLNDVAHA